MINSDILRIILAKGAGDSTLKKIHKFIISDMSYSLYDICNNIDLMCSIGIKQDVANNIYYNKENSLLMEDMLYQNNIDMCWLGDDFYPDRLKKMNINDIPPILFFKGNYNLLKNKCVGFTGSRKVSDSGRRITDSSARQLSSEGITTISGYANGVDLTAHKAALQSGGSTIFVIVEGILKYRVKGEIKELLNDKNHLFVSQFQPNPMKRNHTIIGLSDAMILIESGLNGGTFNAGKLSLQNKKPLFVVEYGVSKTTAEGNNYFLQHGGVPLKGDKNGKPILKNIYSVLAQNEIKNVYEQLSLELI